MAHQYAVSILSGLIGGSGVVGLVVALFGKRWVDGFLEKTKAGYSRELAELQDQYAQRLEAIRGEIGRAVFVTNAHFETEFDALKRTFEALTSLKLNFLGLRPFTEIGVPKDEMERQKLLAEKLSSSVDAFNSFMRTYQNLSPFYPENINAKFEECQAAAGLEIDQVRMGRRNRTMVEWYGEARENQQRFVAAYQSASELIRDRISSLAVTGRTPHA